MKNIVKLSLLALVPAFLVGGELNYSGDIATAVETDRFAPITEAEKFISGFPAFYDGGARIGINTVTVDYNTTDKSLLTSINATLTRVKGFSVSEYIFGRDTRYVYSPTYHIATPPVNLTDAYAAIDVYSNYFLDINFYLAAQNRKIAYSEFDNVFGAVKPVCRPNYYCAAVVVNADINYIQNWIVYNADVSKHIAAYYQKLLINGVFKEANCAVAGTSWKCSKEDGTYYYEWSANKNQYSEYGVYWYKGFKNQPIRAF
ncbi:MAG: hypothetical protein LBS73_04175 [Campylobacteraceae bacterium]|jgi:hypothetical protein|nr:hypothetical protein [Campylobacteraceae bacterium]